MRSTKKAVVSGRLIYELGCWSDAYFATRSSEITDFFCWKCKRKFHGISMYEHFAKCSPVFFKRISHPKDEKLPQEYFERDLLGKVIKKTRKVEVGHVKQGGCSAFDPDGVSPELQGEVVLPKPEEDGGPLFSPSRGEDVKSKPEPVSKVIGGLQDHIEDPETFKATL